MPRVTIINKWGEGASATVLKFIPGVKLPKTPTVYTLINFNTRGNNFVILFPEKFERDSYFTSSTL